MSSMEYDNFAHHTFGLICNINRSLIFYLRYYTACICEIKHHSTELSLTKIPSSVATYLSVNDLQEDLYKLHKIYGVLFDLNIKSNNKDTSGKPIE